MSLPAKRICSNDNFDGRDRLSEMPDEVIVHILSCLPPLDAVRTVLLSCFGNLWTLVHTLSFDAEEFNDSPPRDKNQRFTAAEMRAYCSDVTDKFIVFVRNVLLLHKTLSIHKFHLSIKSLWYSNKAAEDIKIWLRVALEKQAKEIEFSDVSWPIHQHDSILPDLKSRYLVKLVLNYCKIEPQLQVNLGSLKKLGLHNCNVSDEAFQRFISGCPSLQELSIEDPITLKKLRFRAPNIDKLSLSVSKVDQMMIPLLLDCPNLKTLDLVINCRLPKVLDVSSVRHVNVMYFHYCTNDDLEDGDEDEYRMDDDDDEDDKRTIFDRFLGKFEATEVFQVSCQASVGFLGTIRFHNCFQIRWKRVILELQMLSQSRLEGICHLIRSLEHLEELIIYTNKDFEVHTNVAPLKHSSSSRVMPRLTTITLHSHMKSWNHQQRLVECLLKSTPYANKLVIVPIMN